MKNWKLDEKILILNGPKNGEAYNAYIYFPDNTTFGDCLQQPS
jgi:hypothetical protein